MRSKPEDRNRGALRILGAVMFSQWHQVFSVAGDQVVGHLQPRHIPGLGCRGGRPWTTSGRCSGSMMWAAFRSALIA